MKKLLLAAAATCGLLTSAHANITPVNQVGAWQIAIDPSRNGCLMQTIYPGGMLRLGVDPVQHVEYIVLGNPRYNLIAGQTYQLTLRIDNNPVVAWTGKAHMMIGGEFVVFEMDTDNANVFQAIADGSYIDMHWLNGNIALQGYLVGSHAAMLSMIQCAQAMPGIPHAPPPVAPAAPAEPLTHF